MSAADVRYAVENAFRDYETAGVPSSGEHEPLKSDIRYALGVLLQTALESAGAGLASYATVGDRNADTSKPVGTLAYVYRNNGSATDAANGFYQWTGSAWESAEWIDSLIENKAVSAISGKGFAAGPVSQRGPTPFQTYDNGFHWFVTDFSPPRLTAWFTAGNPDMNGDVQPTARWVGYLTPAEVKNLAIGFTGRLPQANVAGINGYDTIADDLATLGTTFSARIADFRARALTSTAPLAVALDWDADGALTGFVLSWGVGYSVALGGAVRSFRPPIWSQQTRLTSIGDSMMEGKWVEGAAAVLGLTVNNVAKYSSGAFQSYRLGTRQLLFTVTGNSIPASGTGVAVTAINGGPPSFDATDDAFSGRRFLNTYPGDTIATNCSVSGWYGGRHGVVSVPNGGTVAYTFTPDDGVTTATAVAAQSKFVPDNLARLAVDELWIRMSQNYFYADYTPVFPNNINPRVLDDIQGIVDQARGQRIIILALTPGNDFLPGTKIYDALRYFNNQLRVRWPQYAAYLTGVTYSGSSFTGNNMDFIRQYGRDGSANDQADYDNGLLPRSCMASTSAGEVHLNAKGQALEAQFLQLYRVAQAVPPTITANTLFTLTASATNPRTTAVTTANASTSISAFQAIRASDITETADAKVMTAAERMTVARTGAAMPEGPFYYLRKQVVVATVDNALVPANITYLDRSRVDFTTPEGATFVNRLTLNEWDFDDTGRYYLAYKQIDYAVTGQDLKPAEARWVDGAVYQIPTPITEWQTITTEGRVYAGYAEISFAVIDASKKIGTAVKLDGSVYDPTKATPVVAPPTAVLCLGDSITAGPYPEALAALSGRTVTKLAIGGQTSRHIVGRASSTGYRLTLANNQIVSGANSVTAINGAALVGMSGISSANVQFLSTASGNQTYTATGWLGSVHGTLTRTASGGPPSTSETYTFTPDSGYTLPISLPSQTPFVVDQALDSRVIIAWLGRNNYTDTTQLFADVESVFRRFGEQRLVLMSVLNGDYPNERASATSPTGYNAIRLIENTLGEKYPRHFLNIRRKMIDLGLGMLGITPTSQDLTDIADDTVPQSLRGDNVHPTTACYQQVIAPLVNAHLIERGL